MALSHRSVNSDLSSGCKCGLKRENCTERTNPSCRGWALYRAWRMMMMISWQWWWWWWQWWWWRSHPQKDSSSQLTFQRARYLRRWLTSGGWSGNRDRPPSWCSPGWSSWCSWWYCCAWPPDQKGGQGWNNHYHQHYQYHHDYYFYHYHHRLEERARVKCDQYWPTRGTETYGVMCVTLTDTQVIMAMAMMIMVKTDKSTRYRDVNRFEGFSYLAPYVWSSM